jgi:hypothetical protein
MDMARAVDWGSWPIFMSQPVAPLALLSFPWWLVIFVVTALNVVWSLFIRYRLVIPFLAFWGAIVVRLKWIVCPVAAYLLWRKGLKGTAALALFWPLAILVVPQASTQIGVIQKMFMQCLGYEPTQET